MQGLLTVHVKHGYVGMGPMTDKKLCYMVLKALGFDWLKNHTGVIFVKPNQNDIKGQRLCKALKYFIGLKISD